MWNEAEIISDFIQSQPDPGRLVTERPEVRIVSDDANIGTDILNALDRAVPDHARWLHDRIDDNAHSHIKAAILGPSESLPVADGDLVLGVWQRIILLEFDGPRTRRVHVQVFG